MLTNLIQNTNAARIRTKHLWTTKSKTQNPLLIQLIIFVNLKMNIINMSLKKFAK